MQLNSLSLRGPSAQRWIAGATDGVTFSAAFAQVYDGAQPAATLQPFVEVVIDEDHDYGFVEGFGRAMDLAMDELVGHLALVRVEVRLADLIPRLDPVQHRPDLVQYDEETATFTQTHANPEQGDHYG